jgi:ribA/ribD-fused uncharacterized protein
MRTVAVDADSLRQILEALVGPGHLIRELQATRLLPGIESPITRLVNEYNASETEGCRGLDTAEHVCFYEQDFYVLSNFSSFRLKWRGLDFDTSEAAYHYEKFVDATPEIAEQIRYAPSAHEAFKIAERCKTDRRRDWDNVKVDVMRAILRAKAQQHAYVRRKLLQTGDRLLVENSWRDPYWGWGPDRNGRNMLGRLWMEIREELRKNAGALARVQEGEVIR